MALATALQSAHSWEEPVREHAQLATVFAASVSISILGHSWIWADADIVSRVAYLADNLQTWVLYPHDIKIL